MVLGLVGRGRSAAPVSRQVSILLAITLLLAAAAWLLRTPRLPLRADLTRYSLDIDFPLLGVGESLAHYNAGDHLFIDTRVGADADLARIPGAFPIRLASFEDDLRDVLDFIYPEDPLILYGDGDLQALAAVAQRFRDRGYGNLSLMEGGIAAWEQAGGPLARAEAGDDG